MANEGDESIKKEKEKEKKKWLLVSPIARPLAGKRLSKKTLKLVRKAAQNKQIRRGVKEVVKAVRKGQKGLCIIAGDISPIDVIAHVPVMCEEAEIPYIYVSSKEELGGAAVQKRPACCMLVLTAPIKGEVDREDKEKFKVDFDEVVADVKELSSSVY